MKLIKYVMNDGGRADSGYKGQVGDCVLRSIVIASGKNYKEVRKELMDRARSKRCKSVSVFRGVAKKVYHDYIINLGFEWTPTMTIGSGCKVHLKEDELPSGNLIVRLSKHLTAVIDGVVNDIYDPNYKVDFDGNPQARCVYGYYRKVT